MSLLKKLAAFLIFSACIQVPVKAQSPSKYPTLLWKISGNGLSKPSYLYGTMHVSKKLVYHLSDQFFDAINSADVVGLETNPGTWINEMDKYGLFDNYNYSRSYYSNRLIDFYGNAFKIYMPNNKMYADMLAFDPDVVNGLLYRFGANNENFEESTYIDLFIYQTASKWNKKVVSLEDFRTSMIKGKLGELPDLNEETGEADYNYRKYKNMYNAYEKIEDAYRQGNLDLLDSLSIVSGRTKNYQKYLLEDRNEVFVHSMDSIMKTKSLFTGVGAAHLPGSKGVIELLRQKGYTVEPVFPKSSKKGDKLKEEMDKTFKPVEFVKQYAADSLFSFSAPGKLVSIANSNNSSFQLFADMINGSFYSVVRIKTFAPVYGYDQQKMKSKIDSLLYENIPGKILSRAEIKVNDEWVGYDITNETRRGDQQRYQIYISDMELIIFKLGGKAEYIKRSDAKQFFSSIQFVPRSNGDKLFSPVNKGFEVMAPEVHFYEKSYGGQNVGQGEVFTAYDRSKGLFYGVSQAYYNDFNYIEEDTFELNILSRNALKDFSFKTNQTYKILSGKGFPTIEFSGENTTTHRKMYGKLIIKGVHYYMAYAIGQSQMMYPVSFFDSFKLTEFNYTNERKVITDRVCMFTAKDEITENKGSDIDAKVEEEYQRLKDSTAAKKSDDSFDYTYNNKTYFSPSSGEHIDIEFEKFNDYERRNKKEIWDNVKKYMVKRSTGYVTNEKKTEVNGQYKYEFTVKDTGSVRALRVILIFKDGASYSASAPFDTIIGMQGWTKDFMETYAPMDSVIGKDIFANKFDKLVTDLRSSDSTIKAHAEVSLSKYYFEKDNIGEFMKLMADKDLSKISQESRAILFVNGGTLGDERIIAPYKTLYGQYSDSSYLQICMIKGLGYLKTKNAYLAISQLLVNEPPLLGSESTVSDVFATFYDSLELSKNLFPGIMKLVQFDEYKEPVYDLLTALVHKKMLTTAEYQTWKSNILTEANYELKRYNASSNDTKNNTYDEQAAADIAANLEAELQAMLGEAQSGNGTTGSQSNTGKQDSYQEISSKSLLTKYAILLAPYYKTDAAVANWFGKLFKVKSDVINMSAYLELLKQGENPNDTIWNYYSKKPETRLALYKNLEKLKKLDLFNKDVMNQQAFCEAAIQKSVLYVSYDSDDKKGPEKLTLVKILDVKNKWEHGKMYVFARPEDKYKNLRWAYAFVPDKNTLTADIDVQETSKTIETDKTEKEYLDEIAEEFYLQHHDRVKKNYGGAYENFNLGY
ncbi:MAG: TraB/GumN family protein [Bacteroidetes bacterium]|nr:TraB/GumN family protein [Bacteroidota bacterium]